MDLLEKVSNADISDTTLSETRQPNKRVRIIVTMADVQINVEIEPEDMLSSDRSYSVILLLFHRLLLLSFVCVFVFSRCFEN